MSSYLEEELFRIFLARPALYKGFHFFAFFGFVADFLFFFLASTSFLFPIYADEDRITPSLARTFLIAEVTLGTSEILSRVFSGVIFGSFLLYFGEFYIWLFGSP